jgi:hypothetical protein
MRGIHEKFTQSKRAQIECRGMAATLATNFLGRFEKAHPIDLAQRAQRAKTGFPFRMKRR